MGFPLRKIIHFVVLGHILECVHLIASCMATVIMEAYTYLTLVYVSPPMSPRVRTGRELYVYFAWIHEKETIWKHGQPWFSHIHLSWISHIINLFFFYLLLFFFALRAGNVFRHYVGKFVCCSDETYLPACVSFEAKPINTTLYMNSIEWLRFLFI